MNFDTMTADELSEQIARYRRLERMINDDRTREALTHLIEIAETRLRLLKFPHANRSETT